MIEKNLDGLHEACFGGVVQRGRPSAVAHLDSLASVIDARAVPQQGRDVRGIVLSTLISGARKLDPSSRPVDTSAGALLTGAATFTTVHALRPLWIAWKSVVAFPATRAAR